MAWNWQHKNWPHFEYDETLFQESESLFLRQSGMFQGSVKHLNNGEITDLHIELLSQEALLTSQIEGEILNRDSIQSSIRKAFGLQANRQKIPPAEYGISEVMVDVYRQFDKDLTHDMLYHWHALMTNGRKDLRCMGEYRNHEDPMQIVSGPIDRETVHFEAVPSHRVMGEMNTFIEWFNHSKDTLGKHYPLVRASIAHLYFESIHPFEDGNGRLGRALVEKALSQNAQMPNLLGLSTAIETNRKDYYQYLKISSQSLAINPWIEYFSKVILEAQNLSQSLINFIIAKAQFYHRYKDQLNSRQEVVLARIFQEGLSGFKGGLSAENYIRIAKTSASTATRDLQALLELGAIRKTGERKGTRYFPNL